MLILIVSVRNLIIREITKCRRALRGLRTISIRCLTTVDFSLLTENCFIFRNYSADFRCHSNGLCELWRHLSLIPSAGSARGPKPMKFSELREKINGRL